LTVPVAADAEQARLSKERQEMVELFKREQNRRTEAACPRVAPAPGMSSATTSFERRPRVAGKSGGFGLPQPAAFYPLQTAAYAVGSR
jgi:hypothetical protein